MDHNERLTDHEQRLIYLETIVNRLDEHHKVDKVAERLAKVETSVATLQTKPKNGNGHDAEIDKRLRWVERIIFGSMGAILVIKWLSERS